MRTQFAYGKWLLVAAAAIMTPRIATASMLVDTGGYHNGFTASRVISADQYLAGNITLNSASVLTAIEAFVMEDFYNAAVISINLYADRGGTIGTRLFGTSFATVARRSTAAKWLGASNLNWNIGAGSYWISLEGQTPFVMIGAPINGAVRPLPAYLESRDKGASWYRNDLNWGLRVGGVAAAAVPEPATWIAMLAGFGMVGHSLRQRRGRWRTA